MYSVGAFEKNAKTSDNESNNPADLVSAIAEHSELQAESSAHPLNTDRSDESKESIEALFGFGPMEVVGIQSFIEHHKQQYFESNPGQDVVPQVAQDDEWNRLYD